MDSVLSRNAPIVELHARNQFFPKPLILLTAITIIVALGIYILRRSGHPIRLSGQPLNPSLHTLGTPTPTQPTKTDYTHYEATQEEQSKYQDVKVKEFTQTDHNSVIGSPGLGINGMLTIPKAVVATLMSLKVVSGYITAETMGLANGQMFWRIEGELETNEPFYWRLSSQGKVLHHVDRNGCFGSGKSSRRIPIQEILDAVAR